MPFRWVHLSGLLHINTSQGQKRIKTTRLVLKKLQVALKLTHTDVSGLMLFWWFWSVAFVLSKASFLDEFGGFVASIPKLCA